MDQAQLQIEIAVQADRVLSGLASVERSLASLGQAHQQSAQQTEQHGATLDRFGGSLETVARYANLFAAFEAIKQGLAAFDGLEQRNIDLLRTTEILQGNATAASTWSVVAHEMGIDIDQIDRAFTHLSTDLNSGSNPALKQMGIAAEDSNGKIRPLNDVINQAADYFHAHAGAANNSALANALFGRSGYELLPVLEQGTAGLQAITEEARKYGLILDSTTIQRNAAFTFELKDTQLALDGVGIAIGNAALPGIAALGQALSKVIEDNLPTFVAMIDRAISYVIGFIEGVTGMTVQVGAGALALSDLSSITGETGSAMNSASSASNALADAIQRVRDRTKAQTDAIDDQVNALQRQQQAQQFMDQQARLQEELANKSHDIDKLRQQQYQQFWLGNFQTAADIGDQITQAEQAQGDLRRQINQGTLDQQTKDQVSALQAQKQSIQEAANKQIEAMQKAARGTTDALSAAAAGVPPLFSRAGKEAAISFAQDFESTIEGSDMGKKLQDAILGPIEDVQDAGKGGLGKEKIIRGAPQWQAVGKAIGEAIGTGATTALGKSFDDWFTRASHQLLSTIGGLEQLNVKVAANFALDPAGTIIRLFAAAFQQAGLSFDEGGFVPGPEGQARIIEAHSGELILNRAQQGAVTRALDSVGQTLEPFIGPTVSIASGSGPKSAASAAAAAAPAVASNPSIAAAASVLAPLIASSAGPGAPAMAAMLDRFETGGFVTGGSEGDEKPVIAHVGEVIFNRRQQGALAAALGQDSVGAALAPFLGATAPIQTSAQAAAAASNPVSIPRVASSAPQGAIAAASVRSSPFSVAPRAGDSSPAAQLLRIDTRASGGTDMSETNRLLRMLVEAMKGPGGSGSSTGIEALVHELVDRGVVNRRRIGAGSFGR